MAGHAGAAAGRPQQRRQHPHGGRLAGAVRPEEGVDLALGDLEVDAADGLDAAVELPLQRLGLRSPPSRRDSREAGSRPSGLVARDEVGPVQEPRLVVRACVLALAADVAVRLGVGEEVLQPLVRGDARRDLAVLPAAARDPDVVAALALERERRQPRGRRQGDDVALVDPQRVSQREDRLLPVVGLDLEDRRRALQPELAACPSCAGSRSRRWGSRRTRPSPRPRRRSSRSSFEGFARSTLQATILPLLGALNRLALPSTLRWKPVTWPVIWHSLGDCSEQPAGGCPASCRAPSRARRRPRRGEPAGDHGRGRTAAATATARARGGRRSGWIWDVGKSLNLVEHGGDRECCGPPFEAS